MASGLMDSTVAFDMSTLYLIQTYKVGLMSVVTSIHNLQWESYYWHGKENTMSGTDKLEVFKQEWGTSLM